jgi:sucrose-6-phosphate hydrolase SacC (GH32 family)
MYRNGVYHQFWQSFVSEGSKLSWSHAVSKDFVKWLPLPVAFGGGAESGGAIQLANGSVVTMFNYRGAGGGGKWAATPTNHSDPLLETWRFVGTFV